MLFWHGLCNEIGRVGRKTKHAWDKQQDMNMKATNIEDRLAMLAALVVLVGVTFAAGDALAQEAAGVTTTAVAIHDTSVSTLANAEQANEEAAAHAAESLALTNWIDLDIQLVDRTSTLLVSLK